MAQEIYTVTVPELPPLAQITGREQIAVYRDDRLGRIEQASLRGNRTFSGPTVPPVEPTFLLSIVPILGDRWRNTSTGDEWKISSLNPVTWLPDGNVRGADGISNIPGPAGRPGGKGDKGAPGNLAVLFALASIQADTVVVSSGDGGCIPADPTDDTHRGHVLGVVHQAVPAGGLAAIQSAGALEGAAGNFADGDALFIAADGTLTNVAPSSGWRQQIGVAASGSRIVLNLGPAYDLPDAAALIVAPGDDAITKALLAALVPDLFDRILLTVAQAKPLLPQDGTIPAEGGWFRRGSAEIFDLVYIAPRS